MFNIVKFIHLPVKYIKNEIILFRIQSQFRAFSKNKYKRIVMQREGDKGLLTLHNNRMCQY